MSATGHQQLKSDLCCLLCHGDNDLGLVPLRLETICIGFLQLDDQVTGLAPVAGVASRTIWCRALEYGLVQPAGPVYIDDHDEVGGAGAPSPRSQMMSSMGLCTTFSKFGTSNEIGK